MPTTGTNYKGTKLSTNNKFWHARRQRIRVLRQQQRPMIWLLAITACYVAVATS